MATYRLEAKIIGRTQGRSATASAAYRAGERVEDARTGQRFDYTRKRGVLHAEIMAPPDTPAWMLDRSALWNAVEAAEKRKDAQLARDLVLSLPHELTADQRRDLVRDFVGARFVAQGMIADIAIHAPDRKADQRNHHAHVLLTLRELTGGGFGNKVRAWNDKDQLEAWRETWAETVNRHLERHGHEARVDHRSLKDQGIDREAEPKQGPVATEMEREGRASHAGHDRKTAQARNAERAALSAERDAVTASIVDLERERAKRSGEGDGMMKPQHEDTGRAAEPPILPSPPSTQLPTQPPEAPAPEAEQARLPLEKSAQDNADRPAEPEHQAEESGKAARQGEPMRQDAPRKQNAPPPEALARDNADKQIRQAADLNRQRVRLDAFEAEQKRQAEDARRLDATREEEKRKREAEGRGVLGEEGDIREAGDRYRVALGQNYDVMDPYRSLARAAMSEYGAFVRDREQLQQQIAHEQDPEARRALELRRDIQDMDYLEITSRRIARQSDLITGREDGEEAVRFRDRAAGYKAESQTLRQELRDHAAERAAREADDAAPRPAQGNETPPDGSRPAEPQPSTRATREAKDRDDAQSKGEISDEKAQRIARIREQGRAFESAETERQINPGHDRGGGRSR